MGLDAFEAFSTRFSLPLTRTQVKFLFYSHDSDLDCRLTKDEVRLLLVNLVEPAAVSHHASPYHGPADADESKAGASSEVQPLVGSGSNSGSNSPTNAGKHALTTTKNGYGLLNSGDGYEGIAIVDGGDDGAAGSDDDEDDDEDGDHGHAAMTSSQKLRWAAIFILGGTLCVSIFADPMVDVIGCVGEKLSIPAFYVSFIVTPLASNASEVIASLRFAAKKTDMAMGLTLSSLYGAATMNNTFCLSIFLGLVYFRGLAWTYTAEVTGILAVTFIVGCIGTRQTIKMWQAAVVLALFPLSIILIYALNSIGLQ